MFIQTFLAILWNMSIFLWLQSVQWWRIKTNKLFFPNSLPNMLLLTCMDKKIYIHSYKKIENSAGAFQSDALLVPEHCLFDHIHNQTKCWDFDQWNRTASNACQERGMKVKSFAMLLPCGIDVFSGVEFVCCPSSKAASTTKKGLHSVVFCPFLSGPFYFSSS